MRLSRRFFACRSSRIKRWFVAHYTVGAMNAFPILFALLLPLTNNAADNSLLLQSTLPARNDGEQKRSQLQLDWRESPSWQLQWRHDYRIFDYPEPTSPEPLAPASNNGHVHQLALALTKASSSWRLRLQPIIATSSNALREQALHRADWRLQGEVSWLFSHYHDDDDAWQLGLRMDDQLGRYRAYPSIGWQPAFATGMQQQLGWPNSSFQWSFAEAWQLRGFLKPAGGQWHVYDETHERDSELYYRQWLLGGELHWQLAEHWQVHLGLQREFDQRLRYRLQDGQTITLQQPDQTRLQLSLQWTF